MGGNSSAGTGSRRFETDEMQWIRRILIALMCTLILVAVIEVALWVWASNTSRATMRNDLFRAMLNLGIVAIIGGGIAALYKWIEREIEAARLRASVRAQYISRMGAAYRSVKKARRMLRAEGVIGNSCDPGSMLSENQTARYDHHMSCITDAQLELEALKIEAKTLPDVVTIAGLEGELRTMEKYLRKLIKEYETARPGDEVQRGDLKLLHAFADQRSSNDFRSGFAEPHELAIRLISQRL